MRKIIMTDLMMIARIEKPQRAIDFIDEVMEEIDFTDSERLRIYQMKLNLVRQLKDNARMDALLDEMIALEGVVGETRQRLIVKKIYLMVGTQRQDEAMQVLKKAIVDGQGSMHLYLAKGQLHSAKKEYAQAIEAYDEALKTARNNPDIMIDLVSAKADAMFELDDAAGALRELSDFSDDTQMPSDLRAEALLHQAMIMRDMKRTRQARLAENRAIQITESPKERAEMQKIVERLREKFGG
jgi:tetratricopeptide (TPR) repeat protein